SFIASCLTYCRLWRSASAIGPYTTPRAETPVCRRSVMSLMLQSPSLASRLEVREGAYQFCIGISPPLKASACGVPPSALIGEWHMPQWPSPSTRYEPRFHSADLLGSDL